MELAIAFFSITFVLFLVGMWQKRQSTVLPTDVNVPATGIPTLSERPRPQVVEFHVRGNEAHVRFDVPLAADGADTVLSDLLVAEAIEVVREKQASLPISDVEHVVAFAGRGQDPVEVGRVALPERGALPEPSEVMPSAHIGHLGFDPIEKQFEQGREMSAPEIVSRPDSDDLSPIGMELRLPKAVDFGLRAQGVDPDTMSAGELVRGLLISFGYSVRSSGQDTYVASKAGAETFISEIPHTPGDHPELDEAVAKTFLFEFLSSKAQRGLLVSDKFCPFSVYEMERNEPRVQFVTRERLQNFVDAAALS